MKRMLAFMAVGLLTMPSLGCFGKTAVNTTPKPIESTTAEYGKKISDTVRAAQTAVHGVGTASESLVVKKGALAALQGLDKVNLVGIDLADVLNKIAAVRAAGQPVTGDLLAQAQALIDKIDVAIDLDVIPHLGDNPEVKAGLDAVRAISKLALEIQLYLGQLKGGA